MSDPPPKITLHPNELQMFGFAFETNADGSVKDKIGSGAFGAVYRGICLPGATNWYSNSEDGSDVNLEGIPCAIKCLHVSPKQVDLIYNEAKVLSELKHENIVEIFAVIKIENVTCYIVMEFLMGGTLTHFLHQRLLAMKKLSKEETIDILMQLINGLEYLHQRGKAHRDLHGGNVMCTMSANDKYVWKYVDFGVVTTDKTDDIEEKLTDDIENLGSLFHRVLMDSVITDNELVNIKNRMRNREYQSIVNVSKDIRNRLEQYL